MNCVLMLIGFIEVVIKSVSILKIFEYFEVYVPMNFFYFKTK